jgi:8-oxo-dGTP pyrophosphatase MutT (NUDIX family)
MTTDHQNLPFSSACGDPNQGQDESHKVCVFLTYQGVLVLVLRQHSDGVVSVEPVGGKKKVGETTVQACAREVSEELGVVVNEDDSAFFLLGTQIHPFKGYEVSFFAGCYEGGVPRNALPDEHLAILQVPLGDNFYDEALKQVENTLADLGIQPNGDVQLRVPREILSRCQQIMAGESGVAFKPNEWAPV